MYDLVVTPAKPPADFPAAVRTLYEHAHHLHQTVRHEGQFDGRHRYALLDFRDQKPVSFATIAEHTEQDA